LYLVIPLVNG